jgi:hypothetical protein
MRAVSAQFAATVARSHVMVTTVSVLASGATVIADLPVDDGVIQYDRTAKHLARLDSLVVADPSLVPLDAADPLTPYGYELAVRRGVRYPDGTTETVGLGVFPIRRSRVTGVQTAITLGLMDRSATVSDARLEDDVSIAAGTNYATAIRQMVAGAGIPLSYQFATLTATTPLLVFPAFTDRWEAAQGMARSCGCELYFDGDGCCVLRTEPVLTGAPDVTVSETSLTDPGTLLDVSVDLDREDAYNRVVAWSSNPALTQVYRGVATDDDPASPTYYLGQFGRKPREYASPFIASTVQAIAAAQGILASNLGIVRSAEVAMFPNPAIEPGDVVRVVQSGPWAFDTTMIADRMTVSLGPESPMTLAARTRQA